MKKIVFTSIFSSAIGTLFLLSPLNVIAKSGDPNGISNQPQPGWSLWRPQAQAQKADFTAGFSNIELGGYLDFENACEQKSGLPKDKIEYWFRLSNSVNRIGTGTAETGCWMNGRFLATHTSTAVKTSLSNVEYLCVKTATGKGLVIRSEPKEKSKRIGIVANGKRVKVDSFPALIVEADNQNWVAVSSPVQGWVSDGSPASQGNLRLCRTMNNNQ